MSKLSAQLMSVVSDFFFLQLLNNKSGRISFADGQLFVRNYYMRTPLSTNHVYTLLSKKLY